MGIFKRLATLVVLVTLSGCAAHEQPKAKPAMVDGSEGARSEGSVVANIWYVPGRALICGSSAVLAGVVLTVTLGQEYESASDIMRGGCGGPWVLSSEDVR